MRFAVPLAPLTALLIQASLPLVTIIGYIAIASFGQSRNMLMMIPMVLSVVASTTALVRRCSTSLSA